MILILKNQKFNNKIQIIKPFSKCRRTQYHPKDILTLFKENYLNLSWILKDSGKELCIV